MKQPPNVTVEHTVEHPADALAEPSLLPGAAAALAVPGKPVEASPTGPHGITEWRTAYLAGASPQALLTARLQHLQARGADAAWIHRSDEAALLQRLAQLQQLEAQYTSRATLLQRHPLWGVPFAVKDNIDVAGLPTTAACPAFAHSAQISATVVRRLLDAGAVLMGKTNLDQFATGLVGTRSPYGAPASVWAAQRVSGGSSSGSAVVVARGDVAFALGTDTAGSGRVPAGFNHIVGLKPTPGRVSTAGVVPACRSLDCVSIFALRVHDAASVLAVIEGADAADIYSHFSTGTAQLTHKPRLRVGVPMAPKLSAVLGYHGAWSKALQQLEQLGAQLVPLDFAPLHEVARLLYDGPWVAERHAVVQSLLTQQPDALDATVARVIAHANHFSATDTFRALYHLREAQAEANHLWQQVDTLMVPTAPHHPSFEEVKADPIGANAQLGTYTNFVNLLGWCALAVPADITSAGVPFGVTFIAPAAADAALARWGQRWQHAVAQPLGATGQFIQAAEATAVLAPATTATLPVAVVGAHLSGLPLNGQLTERGAVLREATTTAAAYRLFALPGTQPPKPGLQRVKSGGVAIALEVWEMPQAQLGSFLALIPPPLGLGSIELADGRQVHGFLCEAHALEAAADISHHGSWRAYLANR
jgi:allophanate hydrolase